MGEARREARGRGQDAEPEPPLVPVLPSVVIKKFATDALPEGVRCSEGYVLLMQECVSELLLFVASAAQERARSTLHSKDIAQGLEDVDLDHFARPVRRYLGLVREAAQKRKREAALAAAEALVELDEGRPTRARRTDARPSRVRRGEEDDED